MKNGKNANSIFGTIGKTLQGLTHRLKSSEPLEVSKQICCVGFLQYGNSGYGDLRCNTEN